MILVPSLAGVKLHVLYFSLKFAPFHDNSCNAINTLVIGFYNNNYVSNLHEE